MAETTENKPVRSITLRYRGRKGQILIYLGKFLRMFIYQSDWKVLPMSAFVAGLVGLVTSGTMFQTMEGTLMGAFSLVMVCIWNGCFNSIQVICRERDVIKREHRSGMHISSYILAHMLYQGILCLLQTAITLYVTNLVGMRYDLCKPLLTPWFVVDFGISLFLITFAADMLSLWISTLAHSTTAAMTIMPFVLIFQLVFSGGMLTLPEWSAPLMKATISAPGLNVVAAQGDYNHRPMVALWNKVQGMGNTEIGGDFSLGQVLDYLNGDSPLAKEILSQEVETSISVGEILDFVFDENNPQTKGIRDIVVGGTITVGQAMDLIEEASNNAQGLESAEAELVVGDAIAVVLEKAGLKETVLGQELSGSLTLGRLLEILEQYGLLEKCRNYQVPIRQSVGQLVDMMNSGADSMAALRDKTFTIKMTVAELQSKLGVENVRVLLQEKAAEGSVNPRYEYTGENIKHYWLRIALLIVAFSSLSVITLEFIDKDKR